MGTMNATERFQAIDNFDCSSIKRRGALAEFNGMPTYYFDEDDSIIKSVTVNSLEVYRDNVEADGENYLRMDVTLNLGEPVKAVAWVSSEGVVDMTDIGDGHLCNLELSGHDARAALKRFGLE